MTLCCGLKICFTQNKFNFTFCYISIYIFFRKISFEKVDYLYQKITQISILLIADQNAAVNTFPGLVHTARHTMGVGNARSR